MIHIFNDVFKKKKYSKRDVKVLYSFNLLDLYVFMKKELCLSKFCIFHWSLSKRYFFNFIGVEMFEEWGPT